LKESEIWKKKKMGNGKNATKWRKRVEKDDEGKEMLLDRTRKRKNCVCMNDLCAKVTGQRGRKGSLYFFQFDGCNCKRWFMGNFLK